MVRRRWFGAAVEKPEILHELQQMKADGIGGAELAFVYPEVLDDPTKNLKNFPFLSPAMLDAVHYAQADNRSAKFIDHQSQMGVAGQEKIQEPLQRHHFRHWIHLALDRLQTRLRITEQLQQVLDVDQADRVVEVAFAQGKAGVARSLSALEILLKTVLGVEKHDVFPRGSDVAHHPSAKVEGNIHENLLPEKKRPPAILRSQPGSHAALPHVRELMCAHRAHLQPALEDQVRGDFASKLTGKIEQVTLPQRGQWIRQGQKVWSIVRNGVKVDMVSPIEGSVSDINEAVVSNPSLAGKDPYGEGWMVTVQSPDAKTNFRNLMGGALARWWTEESSMRLQRLVPNALGALAQDGGAAIDDLAGTIPDEQWVKITREFFLA